MLLLLVPLPVVHIMLAPWDHATTLRTRILEHMALVEYEQMLMLLLPVPLPVVHMTVSQKCAAQAEAQSNGGCVDTTTGTGDHMDGAPHWPPRGQAKYSKVTP